MTYKYKIESLTVEENESFHCPVCKEIIINPNVPYYIPDSLCTHLDFIFIREVNEFEYIKEDFESLECFLRLINSKLRERLDVENLDGMNNYEKLLVGIFSTFGNKTFYKISDGHDYILLCIDNSKDR